MAKKSKSTVVDVEAEAKAVEADTETPWSMSVPAAGKKYYGLGKKASYDNAGPPGSEALIPTVNAGRLLKALPRLIEKRLAGSDN
jgi:hypothetical protein